MSDVSYETAWKFLKKLVGRFKELYARIAQIDAENSSDHHQSMGKEYMAGLILEEMECMEEGIADAMRGDDGDE